MQLVYLWWGETGMDVHVKHETKQGILTKVIKKGEAPGILLYDSVGSVEMLQEHSIITPTTAHT